MEEKIWPLSWKGDVIWIWMKKNVSTYTPKHLLFYFVRTWSMLSRMTRKMSYGICFMCCVSYNVKCWKIQSKSCQRRSGALVDGCVSNNVRLTVIVRSSPLCRRPFLKMFLPAGGWAANACARSGGEGEEGEQEAGGRRRPAEDPGGRGDHRAPAEEAGRDQAGACLSRGTSIDFLSGEGWKLRNFFIIPLLCSLVCCRHVWHFTLNQQCFSIRPFMLWSWTQSTHCEGRWPLDVYKL